MRLRRQRFPYPTTPVPDQDIPPGEGSDRTQAKNWHAQHRLDQGEEEVDSV